MIVTFGLVVAAPLRAAPVGSASSTMSISSSISSGFNSFNIPSGDVIWFASVLQISGNSPSTDLHIHFTGQVLTFTEPDGASFSRAVPSSLVEFNSGVTSATTSWNARAFEWVTVAPLTYGGDTFLSGYSFFVNSSGVPGGTHVTWSGHFSSSDCPYKFNWKWGAAVYTKFAGTAGAPHYASVGVKPVDDNNLSSYLDSDHAGTPEAYKAYLAQGARGGGGSNFTGSYSGTVSVQSGSCP